MKKSFLALAILGSMTALAQATDITTAVIAFDRRNDVEEARKYIDKAGEAIAANPGSLSAKDMGKYYYYKGRIYAQLAGSKGDTVVPDMEQLAIAAASYKECLKLEKETGKKKFSDKADPGLFSVGVQYYNAGIMMSESNKMGSMTAFEAAYDAKASEYREKPQMDTVALFNAALMAEQAEAYEKALSLNQRLIDMNYTGRTFQATNPANGQPVGFPSKASMEKAVAAGLATDPIVSEPITRDLYLAVLRINQKMEKKEAYLAALKVAREKFPEEKIFIDLELNEYLNSENTDEALKSLETAITKDPSNKVYYYIQGSLLYGKKDRENARVSYAKALELDPQYHDALYMTGLTYVDEANAITEEMNKLNLNQTKQYDALKKKQQAKFSEALPYFEKAEQIKPDDVDTLKALKEVYYRTGNNAKAMEMTKRIDAAK